MVKLMRGNTVKKHSTGRETHIGSRQSSTWTKFSQSVRMRKSQVIIFCQQGLDKSCWHSQYWESVSPVSLCFGVLRIIYEFAQYRISLCPSYFWCFEQSSKHSCYLGIMHWSPWLDVAERQEIGANFALQGLIVFAFTVLQRSWVSASLICIQNCLQSAQNKTTVMRLEPPTSSNCRSS